MNPGSLHCVNEEANRAVGHPDPAAIVSLRYTLPPCQIRMLLLGRTAHPRAVGRRVVEPDASEKGLQREGSAWDTVRTPGDKARFEPATGRALTPEIEAAALADWHELRG